MSNVFVFMLSCSIKTKWMNQWIKLRTNEIRKKNPEWIQKEIKYIESSKSRYNSKFTTDETFIFKTILIETLKSKGRHCNSVRESLITNITHDATGLSLSHSHKSFIFKKDNWLYLIGTYCSAACLVLLLLSLFWDATPVSIRKVY